jgi:hypothetical protein
MLGACIVQVHFQQKAGNLDLIGVQEVRADKGSTVRGRDFNFLWKRNENQQLGIGLFYTRE